MGSKKRHDIAGDNLKYDISMKSRKSHSRNNLPARREFYDLICILWTPISVKANEIYNRDGEINM